MQDIRIRETVKVSWGDSLILFIILICLTDATCRIKSDSNRIAQSLEKIAETNQAVDSQGE